MHAQGDRDPQLGAGGNWDGLTSEWRSKIPIRLASFCCRCLREAIHGGTSANTRSERVGLITNATSSSISDGDRRLGMC